MFRSRISIYYFADPDPGPYLSSFGSGSWVEGTQKGQEVKNNPIITLKGIPLIEEAI